MGLHSLRILAQAGFSGVFFAAKILRGELPRYRLPLPEFAANVIPCSAPLIRNLFLCFSSLFGFLGHFFLTNQTSQGNNYLPKIP